MPEGRASRTSTVVSALVAAGFLWWFLRGVSLAAVLAEIRRARVPYLAAAALLSLAGFAFRTWRWQYLVAPLKWVRARSLASAIFIGWTVSAILPGRLGEVARAVLLGREGVRRSAAFGTVVLERLLDMLAVLLLLAASLGFVPASTLGSTQASLMLAIRTGALIAFGALLAITIGILAAHHIPDPVRTVLRTWIGRLPRGLGDYAWGMVEAFGAGLSGALNNATPSGVTPARLRMGIAVHTIVLWTIICGVHALLFRAFGIEASVFRIPALLFLITLGLSVPVPAALGSYHKAVQLGLTGMFAVSHETATGYAIVSHVVTQVLPAVIGAILLAREGLGLSSFSAGSASVRSSAHE